MSHPNMGVVAIASESGSVSLVDIASGKIQKSINDAHKGDSPLNQGASTVSFTQSGLHLISAGHDGTVKLWDLRSGSSPKTPLIDYVSPANQGYGRAHGRKFDEGVMCLSVHPDSSSPFFASGGADSLVNVYELKNII